jgi:ABC-type multidrug transport system ATPase subunit
MSLLVLDGVSKRHAECWAQQQATALRSVSLVIEPGELVGVWGRRRSGRTTLLTVAAGVERPTEGVVRFGGIDMTERSMLGVPRGVAYCASGFPPALGNTVGEQVAAPLLGRGIRVPDANGLVGTALRRVGAEAIAARDPAELSHAELARIMLARALVMEPRLLVLDQPLAGVPPATERDAMLSLLQSLAHRDGIAVLMAVDEAAELAGTDRALTIDMGELRGETNSRELGEVIPLRRRACS